MIVFAELKPRVAGVGARGQAPGAGGDSGRN